MAEDLLDFFCFFDFCGPVMPASRREVLRRLSWEGGIVAAWEREGGAQCDFSPSTELELFYLDYDLRV